MILGAEREAQVQRLKGLLDEADSVVWTNPGYPSKHRPDVAFLRDRIDIGQWRREGSIPHPQMKPEIKQQFINSTAKHDLEASSGFIAWYERKTRGIGFSPLAVVLPDLELRRVVYHEAATDIIDRQTVISSQKYRQRQQFIIREMLKYAFPRKRIPRLEETRIEKTGFVEFLMIGRYTIGQLPIGHLSLNQMRTVDEVYPTMVEIITDQVLRRGGDLAGFNVAVQRGEVGTLESEDHPRFVDTLYSAMHLVTWQSLLDAFKLGDIERTEAFLIAANPQKGKDLLSGLVESMTADQEYVNKKNQSSTFPLRNSLTSAPS